MFLVENETKPYGLLSYKNDGCNTKLGLLVKVLVFKDLFCCYIR